MCAEDSETVKQNWEKIKLTEGRKSVLSGVPRSLPAMIKAQRIKEKAQGVGFDWENASGVWDKVCEEMEELHDEVERGDKEAMKKELGDVFFSLINYAEHLGINAEDALETTNKKFISRFMTMERLIESAGGNISQMSVDDMEVFWQEAKKYDK